MRNPLFRGVLRNYFRRRTPIVFYHGLWPDNSQNIGRFGGIRWRDFRTDMCLLARHFRFVSLDEALRNNTLGTTPDEPALTVCFDDGHEMVHNGAIDLLDELGIKATLFVVNACVDNRHLMWMHKLSAIQYLHGAQALIAGHNQAAPRAGSDRPITSGAELYAAVRLWPMETKEEYTDAIYAACHMPNVDAYLDTHRPYMTWEALREWIKRGHQVGLHTQTHPYCFNLNASQIELEIIAAAEELRERLQLDEIPFAYPFGERLPSIDAERVLQEQAGFSCMLGVNGVSPLPTNAWQLERADVEKGLDDRLFGRPLLHSLLGRG
jgi:peptidoglycan/xylan/chitin deacetylase (PgdA/CDA1 family)